MNKYLPKNYATALTILKKSMKIKNWYKAYFQNYSMWQNAVFVTNRRPENRRSNWGVTPN